MKFLEKLFLRFFVLRWIVFLGHYFWSILVKIIFRICLGFLNFYFLGQFFWNLSFLKQFIFEVISITNQFLNFFIFIINFNFIFQAEIFSHFLNLLNFFDLTNQLFDLIIGSFFIFQIFLKIHFFSRVPHLHLIVNFLFLLC